MAAPKSAFEAGQNLRKNAQSIDIGQLVSSAIAHGASSAFNAVERAVPAVGMLRGALPALQDFAAGAAGQGAQLPSKVANAQQKAAPSPFRGYVEVPGAGKVPVLSQAYMAAHPGEPIVAPARAAPSAAAPVAKAAADPLTQALAFAKDNNLSLAQLAALSDSAYKSSASRSGVKPPTEKEIGMADYRKLATDISNAELQQAQGDPAAYAAASQRALQRLAPFLSADQFSIPQMPDQ